jgi:hypothetical protein
MADKEVTVKFIVHGEESRAGATLEEVFNDTNELACAIGDDFVEMQSYLITGEVGFNGEKVVHIVE